jgi:histidinol-phosphate aminotransferase
MARLSAELRQAGFTVRATEANFILIDFGSEASASAFRRKLENEGVFVRSLMSSNLPGFLRVSIGSREANDAFLTAALRD